MRVPGFTHFVTRFGPRLGPIRTAALVGWSLAGRAYPAQRLGTVHLDTRPRLVAAGAAIRFFAQVFLVRGNFVAGAAIVM